LTQLLRRVTADPACAGEWPETWFPGVGQADIAREAKTICERCPVIDPCLEYALHHFVEGIWAATTEKERVQLRRRRGILAESLTLDWAAYGWRVSPYSRQSRNERDQP
jgi:WhiB family redox-sensing transcriptional regulator